MVTIYYAHPRFLYGTIDEKKDLEVIMNHFPDAKITNPATIRLHHKKSMSIYTYYASLHDIIVYRPVVGRFITAGIYEELIAGLLRGVKIVRISKRGADIVVREVSKIKDYVLTPKESNLLGKALKLVGEQDLINETSSLRSRHRLTPKSALILACTKILSRASKTEWFELLKEFMKDRDVVPKNWLKVIKREDAREKILELISKMEDVVLRLFLQACLEFIDSLEMKTRLINGRYSTLPERVVAYYYGRRLREEGLSYEKIAKEINEIFNMRVSSGKVSNWVKGRHNPLRRCGRVNDCPELAYVIAAWLGDGTLSKDNRTFKHYIVLNTKDIEFARKWGECLAKITGNPKPYRPRWDKSNRRWTVRASNILLWTILIIAKENPWFVYPIFKKYPESACRGWFDAEGYVSPSSYLIGATNTDIEQICIFQKLLEGLSICAEIKPRRDEGTTFISPRSGKISRRLRTNYDLKIYGRENHRKFADLIGFSIPRKMAGLRKLVYRQ